MCGDRTAGRIRDARIVHVSTLAIGEDLLADQIDEELVITIMMEGEA
jgi:hypothetical protein